MEVRNRTILRTLSALLAAGVLWAPSPLQAQLQVTDVRFVRGELELVQTQLGDFYRFQEIEEVEQIILGDIFQVTVEVTNQGSETVMVFNLFAWELDYEDNLEVVGDPGVCAFPYFLGPGESAWLAPFCGTQAFRADRVGPVKMRIRVNGQLFDIPIEVRLFAQHTLNVSSTAGGLVAIPPGEGTHDCDPGEQVTLTAVAEPGYLFTNWSGDLFSTLNPLVFAMDKDYVVTANFGLVTELQTLTVLPTQHGTVSPLPGPHLFTRGTVVPLDATANEDHFFVTWFGTAVQAGEVADPLSPHTTVRLNSSYTVGAMFQAAPSKDSITVGLLTIRGDEVLQRSGNIWTIEGNVTVNDILRIAGTVTVNTATLMVNGDGRIWLDDIPVLGEVQLHDGPWEFDGQTAATTSINKLLARLDLAGMEVKCTHLGIQGTSVTVQGYVNLPEYAGGGRIDITGDHYLRMSSERGLEYDLLIEQAIDVNVAGLVFRSEKASIQLSNEDADQISIYGTYTIDGLSPYLGQVTVDLDPSEGRYLRVMHEAGQIDVQLVGKITLASVIIVPEKVYGKDLVVEVNTVDDNYYGSGTFFFPMGTTQVELECALGIVGGYFDSGSVRASFDPAVCVLYGPGGVPVVYLMSVGAGVHNMSPVTFKPIILEGEAGFQGGPEFFGNRLITLELMGKVDLSGSVQGTAIIHILSLGEKSSVINGEATVTVTAGEGATLDASLEAALGKDPFLFVDGEGSLDVGGNVCGTFNGKLVYPKSWPFGKQLEGIEFPARCQLQSLNDEDEMNDYLLGQAEKLVDLEVFGFSVTFRVTVGFKFFFAKNEWEYWANMERVEEAAEFFASGHAHSLHVGPLVTIDAPEAVESALFYARWETGTTDLYVTTPEGYTIAPSNVQDYPNASYYASETTHEAFYIVQDPKPGTWEMSLSTEEGIGEYSLEQFWTSQPPTIEILDPDSDQSGPEILITWADRDDDDDARINLYYDTDRHGTNGTLIVADLSEDDPNDGYLWNTEGIPTGSYYVYAVISDGKHMPSVSYSVGRTQVVHPDAPSPPRDVAVVPTAQDDGLKVSWAHSSDPNAHSYSVHYTDDAAGDTREKVIAAGERNELLLTGLIPGETYRIAVASVDANSVVGSLSEPTIVTFPHNGNQLPVFTGGILSRAVVDALYECPVLAEDHDGDVITYSLVTGEPNIPDPPNGLMISDDGLLQWIPEPNQLGSHRFVVRLEDEESGTNDRRFKVQVVADDGTNHVPKILSEAPAVAVPGGLYTYQLMGRDPDPLDEYSFELREYPMGATLGADGLLQWLTPEQSGQYEFLVRVSDNHGAFSLQRFAVWVDLVAPSLPDEWAQLSFDAHDSIIITMQPVHDTIGPVKYMFEIAGEATGWLQYPEYTKTGLSPNTSYGVRAKLQDASPSQNESQWSDPVVVYTRADTPPAPVFVVSDMDSMTVQLSAGSNPASTELALYNQSTGMWVAPSGQDSPEPSWADPNTWGELTIGDLLSDRTYHLQCKARNGDDVETDLSPVCAAKTAAPESSVQFTADREWIYENSGWSPAGHVTISGAFARDPVENSAYLYVWQTPVNPNAQDSLVLIDGGGLEDATATYAAPQIHSDVPVPYSVRCTIVGRQAGNSVSGQHDVKVLSRNRCVSDGVAVFKDLNLLAYYWLRADCEGWDGCQGADLDGNNTVDLRDLAALGLIWGQGSLSAPIAH